MHDYLFSTEVVRFAFVTGVVVSMLIYERRHLTTGSIVVPGYIAIFFIQPGVLLATFANAAFSFWLVNKLLPRWFLLYGRGKFTVLVVTSAMIQVLMLRLSPTGAHLWESDVPLLVGAGYVVPALIAHDMARQGIKKTVTAVTAAGALVALPIIAGLLLGLPGINELQPLTGFGISSVAPSWVPFAVVLSILGAWGLQTNLGLRSGGFVGAAYIGMLSAAPSQVVYMIGIALVTYVIVTKGLMPWMILFGRRKFSTMLLLSSVLSWTGMILGQRLFHMDLVYYMTLSSVALLPLFVPGLVANDMERSGVLRVLSGLALGGAFVVPATWVAQDVFEHGVIDPLWAGVAVVAGSAIFHRQVRAIGVLVMRMVGMTAQSEARVAGESTSERPIPTPNVRSVLPVDPVVSIDVAREEELVEMQRAS